MNAKVLALFLATFVSGLVCVGAGHTCSSGVTLRVTLGPTCPVERPGMRCEKPYEGKIEVWDAAGQHLVKTVQTAPNGSARECLAAGKYLLKPVPVKPGTQYPMAKPTMVIVPSHCFITVAIKYDTGMR